MTYLGFVCYNPRYNKQQKGRKMDTNKENVLANIPNTFVITYYADKHQQLITRRGRKDEGCKFKFSKNGKPCFTYFDLDANGYRTATQFFTLKGNI